MNNKETKNMPTPKTTTSKKIEIYTDGSCIGNPGPGGWGVVILKDSTKKPHSTSPQTLSSPLTLSGGSKNTTNNRMEMTAVIKALEYIHKSVPKKDLPSIQIIIHSDSNLIIQTLNKGWKRKANIDLWEKIDPLLLPIWPQITFKWVKAHAANPFNNLADRLALKEAKKQ